MDAGLADLARVVETEGSFGMKVTLELEAATIRGTLVPRAVFLDAQEALAKSTQDAVLAAVFSQARAKPVQPGLLYLIDATLTVRNGPVVSPLKLPSQDGTYAVLSKNSTVAADAVQSWTRGERVALNRPCLELA